MQGSSYKSEPSYYTFGNRRWPVFVRCYRERVKRAKCPQCVSWTILMCGCLRQTRSTIEWWPAAGALLLLNMP